MTFRSLLLSFLGVGALTGTVIGGYCIFGPDKSNNKKSLDKEKDSESKGNQVATSQPVVLDTERAETQTTLETTPTTLASTQIRQDATHNSALAPDSPSKI